MPQVKTTNLQWTDRQKAKERAQGTSSAKVIHERRRHESFFNSLIATEVAKKSS